MLPGLLTSLAHAALLVASCAAWHPQVVGTYPGTVWSEGEKSIDTWIELAPDGRLQGRYILHEPGRDVPGTLAPLGDDDCQVGLFQWTDLYGTGLARLEFNPDRHCFEGAWGRQTINPTLVWHACTRERVTS